MTETMGHAEFAAMIAAYVAGGLEPRERDSFEAHAAGCPACAAALEQALRIDRRLDQLFGDARPAPGFEDRLVQRLRQQRPRRNWIHPAVWRAAGGIAAVLVLGTVGYIGNAIIEGHPLPWTDSPRGYLAARSAGGDRWKESQDETTTTDLRIAESDGARSRWFDAASSADALARKKISDVRHRASSVQSHYEQQLGDSKANGRRGGPSPAAPHLAQGPIAASKPDQDSDGLQDGKDLSAYYTFGLAPAPGSAPSASAASPATPPISDLYRATASNFAEDGAGLKQFGSISVGGGGSAAHQGPQGGQATLSTPQIALDDSYYFKPTQMAGLAQTNAERKLTEEVLGERNAPSSSTEGREAAGEAESEHAEVTESAKKAFGQAPPAQPAPQAGAAQPVVERSPLADRKIIRNGEMEFEVDSFDSSFVQISRIVTEEGGFVSSTNSDKLPNGKVRGAVVLRVPPDRLDTLILKLRALGDLKSQRISAQDVTKVYYDLESELKAARAMEERLLNIIKSGKGEIKDLLEAEKQLGVYRQQIEKLEGEIRYYSNLVSLSTLSITLSERDIRQSGLAAQTEEVNTGIETEDVEKARTDAIKAIEEAKGRIVESNLKKYDAGQLAALIVCDVAPDAAGPLIDRLKQLGRVARLDIERKQTTPTGAAPLPQARIERRETRFTISIYNLANIAPRQTTSLSMAVAGVEETYRSILEAVQARTGRIVASSLDRQKPEQTTATISFEVPSAEADATLLEIRREREVMALTVTDNPDTSNVTAAKRGFSVQIVSLATVPARQTEQQVLATRQSVPDAFRTMLDELAKAEARILVSHLAQQDTSSVSGQLEFEVARAREAELRAALAPLADVISRTVTRSPDVENTVDSKLRIQIRLLSIDQLAPRVSHSLGMAVKDVPAAYREILAAIQEIGARILTSQLNEQDPQNITAAIDFDVLRENAERVEKALAAAGVVYSRAVSRSADTRNTVEMKLRLQVSLRNVEQLPPRETATVMLETSGVEDARGRLIAASDAAGGRTLQDTQAIASNGEVSSHIVLDVPLSGASEIRQQIRDAGTLRVSETSRDPQAPGGVVARARFDVTLTSPGLLVGRDEGLAATIKRALSTSLKGLLWSLNFILIGLLFVGPWALLLWAAWRVLRRRRTHVATAPAPA